MTYAVLGENLIYSGQEPGGIFFGCRMRDFVQDATVIEKRDTSTKITSIEGEEKHAGSVPQARRGQK